MYGPGFRASPMKNRLEAVFGADDPAGRGGEWRLGAGHDRTRQATTSGGGCGGGWRDGYGFHGYEVSRVAGFGQGLVVCRESPCDRSLPKFDSLPWIGHTADNEYVEVQL
jgi:hypothetical protein